MNDHANELRRHARKIGRPAGDIPAVMHAAAAHIEKLERPDMPLERVQAYKQIGELLARVAELEAERTEREPIAWYCDGEDGREYNGCPQMSNGRTGTPLYAAPSITTPVRLTDSEADAVARIHGTGGWQTLADMMKFSRAVETAVLRANGFDIQPARGEGQIMRYGRKLLHSAEYRAAERLAKKHQRKTKFLAGVGQYGYSRSDFNAIAVGRQARETTHFFATKH